MKLIIDIGNTFAKIAFYGHNMQKSYLTSKSDQCLALLQSSSLLPRVSASIISSVKERNRDLIEFLKGKGIKVIELTETTNLPFINRYQTPRTLGHDRLALAAAARKFFPNDNVLVIDAGTSITYDFVNDKGEYLGGAISPGMMMRLKALHTFTDKLPFIEPEEESFPPLIGKQTGEAILSGVLNGIRAEIDGIIDQYKRRFEGLKTLLTGGDYKYFDKRLKNSIFAHPNLVLEGLLEILKFNEKD